MIRTIIGGLFVTIIAATPPAHAAPDPLEECVMRDYLLALQNDIPGLKNDDWPRVINRLRNWWDEELSAGNARQSALARYNMDLLAVESEATHHFGWGKNMLDEMLDPTKNGNALNYAIDSLLVKLVCHTDAPN